MYIYLKANHDYTLVFNSVHLCRLVQHLLNERVQFTVKTNLDDCYIIDTKDFYINGDFDLYNIIKD